MDLGAADFLLGLRLLRKTLMWRPSGIYNYLVTTSSHLKDPEVITEMGWFSQTHALKRIKLGFPMDQVMNNWNGS